MRIHIRKLFLLPALVAGLNLCVAPNGAAQTFTNLHSFAPEMLNDSIGWFTNNEGAFPQAGLLLSGNTLYGTTTTGGYFGQGAVFKVNTDGTGYTILHSFTDRSYNNSLGYYTNSDGVYPYAGLILAGNALYGTASVGGNFENGTVFKINTDGTAFTNLHSFAASSTNALGVYTNSDGSNPNARLILVNNTLYGTAPNGALSGNGSIFAVNTNGTGFTNLHSFTAFGSNPVGDPTNYDGGLPSAGLILLSNALCGTAANGGSFGSGAIFRVNTNGTGFMNLHSFDAIDVLSNTNSEGDGPFAALVLASNSLYGTTAFGGQLSSGTIFKVSADGTGFTNLHDFTITDGGNPQTDLILSGSTLYGNAFGGSFNAGIVFAVNTDGTAFTNLHVFSAFTSGSHINSDGIEPYGSLILSGNTLFGTMYQGGSSGVGTVFGISLPPPRLNITRSGTNVILTWPTYAPGVTLISTTNLALPAVWNTNLPAPTILNGQNTVTNPVSGAQNFYRLIQ